MSNLLPYRWIVVEDDPDWQSYLKLASGQINLPQPTIAASRGEATRALEQRPFHLLSIDQRIPDNKGEPAASLSGIDLLQDVVDTRPFIRKLVYTAHGEVEYANRTGRLGNTEYKEKAVGKDNAKGLTPAAYARLVRVLLEGGERLDLADNDPNRHDPGYILWALGQGRTLLPPALARDCALAFRNGGTPPDWSHVGQGLFSLREHSVYLAWAQACAIGRHMKLPRSDLAPPSRLESMRDIEEHLRGIWQSLDQGRQLGSWKPYITAQNRVGEWLAPGDAYLSEVRPLREQRNIVAHGGFFSEADFLAHASALLALIDALSFWADRPLMAAPQVHPDDPRRLKFTKIAGEGLFPSCDVPARVALPGSAAQRRLRVYMLHETEASGQRRPEQHLIDLFPLISLKEVRGRPPLPCLMKPAGPGRAPMRVSLEDFTPVSLPPDQHEAQALLEMFGDGRHR
jgi:ActR/RegA family two-component response regulator